MLLEADRDAKKFLKVENGKLDIVNNNLKGVLFRTRNGH